MTKHTLTISLFAALLIALTVTTVDAREFKSKKQKTTKAAKVVEAKQDAPAIITVEAQPAAKPTRTAHTAQLPTPAAQSTTKKSIYNSLLNDQTTISEQIGALAAQLQGANGGKAKKISTQINDLTAKLGAVERQIEAFPESIKNPGQSVVEVDEEFNKKMDALAVQMDAMTDPFAGKISSDPELEALYRQHLSENGYSNRSGNATQMSGNSDGLTYRVMIAITKSALPKSAFAGLTDILEQRINSGGVIYYQGSYQSRAEADKACSTILAGHKFRDAFVVAMQGDRRVPLK